MLWGLGVGYVISGMYFGWNLGLPLGGTWGMLVATLIVTVLYVTFILSYAELAIAIPKAGGAFDFGLRAFGPSGGFVLGIAQIVEFLFAPPAIAIGHRGVLQQLSFPAAAAQADRDRRLRRVHRRSTSGASGRPRCSSWGHHRRRRRAAAVHRRHGAALPGGEPVAGRRCPTAGSACSPACRSRSGSTSASRGSRTPPRRRATPSATCASAFLGDGDAGGAGVRRCSSRSIGVAGWEAIVYPTPGAAASDSPLPLAMARVVGNWARSITCW